MLKRLAAFYSVRVISYTFMSNHFLIDISIKPAKLSRNCTVLGDSSRAVLFRRPWLNLRILCRSFEEPHIRARLTP